MIEAIKAESDPRYAECMATLFNDVYLKYTHKKGDKSLHLDAQKLVWDRR